MTRAPDDGAGFRMLGIETSCDETAAAVVVETGHAARPWALRSNVVASQVAIHREWGGVVPELASRQHVRTICGVLREALSTAALTLADIEAVAVTQGPGLVGSLLVGVSFGKALALSLDVPVVPVHHLAGHIESLVLEHGEMPYPAVVLVVSGGHTNLYLVPAPGTYQRLGRTRDDAAGEAFDKVAKLLGLSYPGGPVIDRLAVRGREEAFSFPVARMTHRDRNAPTLAGDLDFSFSGLKTAVARLVRERSAPLSDDERADVCASFQRSVIDALLDRTFEAATRHRARSVGLAGGVSANRQLRHEATARGERAGVPVYVPSLALSTDNAAMIAAAGLRAYRAGVEAGWDLNADASLPMPVLVPA